MYTEKLFVTKLKRVIEENVNFKWSHWKTAPTTDNESFFRTARSRKICEHGGVRSVEDQRAHRWNIAGIYWECATLEYTECREWLRVLTGMNNRLKNLAGKIATLSFAKKYLRHLFSWSWIIYDEEKGNPLSQFDFMFDVFLISNVVEFP